MAEELAIRLIGEPLGFFRAAYAAREAAQLLTGSFFGDSSVGYGSVWFFRWGT